MTPRQDRRHCGKSMKSSTSSAIGLATAGTRESAGAHVIGIDIGGTKLAVGVADSTGRLLASGRVPTDVGGGMRNALYRLGDLCAGGCGVGRRRAAGAGA